MLKITPILLLAAATSALAQTAPSDKSNYSLFNPTPRSLMREMTTDRPDTTESPLTVDAGHFQAEISFFEYTRNKEGDLRTDTWSYLPSNLKVGLLNNLDLQLVFTPYENTRTKFRTFRDTADGFSDDTQLRLKLNLWGNDGTEETHNTAFGIMPFVKFPTGSEELSNDHVEAGIILPLAVDLPNEWSLGLMAEFDLTYNDDEDDYGIDFVHTATLGHDIPWVKNLAFYIEYVGIAPHDTGTTYQAIGSAGLTYQINQDWSLDAGTRIGISDSADDLTLFAGTSFRF